jgi:release factor glutamine methyltransferase
MLDNKIVQYFKENIRLLNKGFERRDLDILINYAFDNKKYNYIENIYSDCYRLSLLKFAIRRRLLNEPISQIIGYRKFWKSIFFVDKNVLDPRPETELIVEKVLELPSSKLSLIDLGTGSGCLAISIARERPNFKVFASDISNDALKVAKINSNFYQTPITFIKSDWFTKIDRKFDVIIANPPYISKKDYNNLPLCIRRFEPKIALFAGSKGLDSFKVIINQFFKYLRPNGMLILEIGSTQRKIIEKIFHYNGYSKIEFFNDLSRKCRVVCVKKDA